MKNEETIVADFPWIVFRLGKSQCAISSERVSSITLLSGNVTDVPDASAHMRGLLSVRGDVIPLLDLRSVFGQSTLLDEYAEFAEMLNHRKHDHLKWAEALRDSIENNTPFTLSTDPHQCTFGKWYDSYRDERPTVNFQLKKIDEPHQRLHHAAVLAQEAQRIADEAERAETLRRIIEEVETQDVPEVVGLLDETAAVLKDNIREQVLVLGEEKHQVGCVVDEVVAVENLSPMGGREVLSKFASTHYVAGISQNEKGLVLLLDESALEQISAKDESCASPLS